MEKYVMIFLCFCAPFFSCLDNPRDNPWDGWKDSSSLQDSEKEDTTPPVPGNSGKIDPLIVNNTEVSLSWTKANDDISTQDDLEYLVAYSNNDNISTPEEMLANGTIAQSWNKDISSININSLTKWNKYYFNTAGTVNYFV